MFSKMLAFALFTLAIAHTTLPSHIPMADAVTLVRALGVNADPNNVATGDNETGSQGWDDKPPSNSDRPVSL
ncbi:hypothetical protein B0H13DRAFT_2316035 [Mycena leptocephala]|nr:hypothetical protein B0H13DRAFT_2316035 [Mycena leptocephala]